MYIHAFKRLRFCALSPFSSSFSPSFFFLSILFISSPCNASVTWLYPPSSSSNALAYNYNDVVYFTWDSNYTNPSITLFCATHDEYFSLYNATVPANGTDPQSFPYADSYNQTCHMSLYCHDSPDCGPVRPSPEFSLLHNQAAAAQTWGLAATASIGKPTAAVTSTSSPSTTSSLAAAKTAGSAVTGTGTGTGPGTATARASSGGDGGGLSTGAKAGIGIGVALGVVAVLAALWFCVVRARRRRGRLGAPKTMMMMGEGQDAVPSGWDRHEMSGEGKVNELQGTPQAELSSVANPVRYG